MGEREDLAPGIDHLIRLVSEHVTGNAQVPLLLGKADCHFEAVQVCQGQRGMGGPLWVP